MKDTDALSARDVVAPPVIDDHEPAARRGVLPARPPLLALAVAALVALGVVVSSPASLLAGVVLAACAYCRRWLPWDAALPVALLAVLVTSVVGGTAAAAAGVDILQAPSLVAAGWAAVAAFLVLASRRAVREGPGLPTRRPFVFVAAQAPAAVVAFVAALQAVSVDRVASWLFLGSDFAEHALLLEAVQRAGGLSYATEAYPRGVHATLAFFSAPGLPEPGTAALLAYDLQLLGCATWLALAALLWTMSSILVRAASAVSLSGRWQVAASWGLGVLVLYYGSLMMVLVPMASAPGIVTAIALATVPLVAQSQPSRTGAWLVLTAVTAIVTVSIAHLWPALLPVPAVAWLAAHRSSALRADARHWLGSARRRPAIAAATCAPLLVGAAVAALPVLALFRGAGFGVAAVPGLLPAPSLLLGACGVAGLLLMARRHRRASALVGASMGACITVAVLTLSAGQGFDLALYYPRKATWFLVVLLLPAAALVLTWLARAAAVLVSRQCARAGAHAGALRAVSWALATAALVAYGLPVLAVNQPLVLRASQEATLDARRSLSVAMDVLDERAPAVVVPVAVGLRPLANRHDTYVISKLLKLRTGQAQTFGLPEGACAALRDVASGSPAVVVTDLDEGVMRAVLRRQGCASADVVRLPGGSRELREAVGRQLLAPPVSAQAG